MQISISYLLLAALASTAAGLPSFHGPVDRKHVSAPFPTDESHAKAYGTGLAFGTGSHTKEHHHHTATGGHAASATHTENHHTASGGHAATATNSDHHHTGSSIHHSSSATLAARAFSETDAHSFTSSFAKPTGTGGFAHESGFGESFGTGHVAHHSHSGSARHSGGFPSLSIPSGSGFGGGAPTGGFLKSTGGNRFPTTFQSSVVAPSSAA